MVITFSPQDGIYVVTLPEWMPRLINRVAVTHGATYEEAARNGQEVLSMLIERAQARGESLPEPSVLQYDDSTVATS
jgi:predicted RNase H-like HicB family nuclease